MVQAARKPVGAGAGTGPQPVATDRTGTRDRGDGRAGADQQGDRGTAVRVRAHRGGTHLPGLHQARRGRPDTAGRSGGRRRLTTPSGAERGETMGHLAAPLAMPEAEIVLRAPAGVALPKVETIWFRTPDGLQLNFKHLPPATGSTDRGPVLLVHGSGVRANLFCPPSIITLPAMLSAEGFDVWMLNWRASIDVQPTEYTFDDAAAQDFPTATREILDRTGRSTLKAVVHCQGSHAFMMSMTAGLLPEYTRVVANSTALHPRSRRAAAVKLP